MHETMTRLYAAAKKLTGISGQSELARALNTSPQVVKNWETRGVSKQGMLMAQRSIGVSASWVESGEGTMEAIGVSRIQTGASHGASASSSPKGISARGSSLIARIEAAESAGSSSPELYDALDKVLDLVAPRSPVATKDGYAGLDTLPEE
jgi:hypothetical protein